MGALASAFWKGLFSPYDSHGIFFFFKLCFCELQKSFQTNGWFISEVVIYVPEGIILSEGVSPSS